MENVNDYKEIDVFKVEYKTPLSDMSWKEYCTHRRIYEHTRDAFDNRERNLEPNGITLSTLDYDWTLSSPFCDPRTIRGFIYSNVYLKACGPDSRIHITDNTDIPYPTERTEHWNMHPEPSTKGWHCFYHKDWQLTEEERNALILELNNQDLLDSIRVQASFSKMN